MSMLLIEPIGNKSVRLVGKGLNAAIVLKPGEPQEIEAALGAKLLKQCSKNIRVSRSRWVASWRELADLTTGIEQSDPRFKPLNNLLAQADTAFECDDWAAFQIAESRVKHMLKDTA